MSGEDVGMDSDDATAMRASLADPDRFSIVFERHHRVIWWYVARLAGREIADETVGDVFVTAFARRGSFDPALGEVRSWLYGIATNRLHTRFRSEARARRAFWRVAGHRVEAIDETAMIDEADAVQTTTRLVIAALADLNRADREQLVLYAWQHLSYEEIAGVLGIPIGTVRSHLSRTRRRLRELLADSGEVLSDTTAKEAL